jgi:uncharacterized membrane protein YhaH (DUF805 family)
MNTRPQPQPPQHELGATLDPRTPMKRAPYAALGVSLAVLKYVGDFTIAALVVRSNPTWLPFDYFQPWRSPIITHLGAEPLLSILLLTWALPFVYIGVISTMRRALDAGWSPWWALAFFVPYLNYFVMLMLCLWPSSDKYAVRDAVYPDPPEVDRAAVALGIATALALGAAMVYVCVKFKGSYAVGLFVGTPFSMGALAGYLSSRRSAPSNSQLFVICMLLDFLASVIGIAFAFEGAICIAMVLPLAMILTYGGALVGRSIARGGRAIQRTSFSAMILLPLFALAEPAHMAHHMLHAVRTSIEVNATPERVWPQLIQFRPIDPPTEWYFRLGIAFPTVSYTEGTGIGATRYCGFSTGSVVEHITAWQPGEVMAFDVSSQPAPMVELSPYKDLDPPHLHGYVRSKKGEFRLVALADGRTRIDGTSWYEIDMQPEAYWAMWTDASVHAIHRRVLEHIKKEVEEGNSATTQAR